MKPLSEEEIAEGWIAHDGEGCPVDKTVIVDVKKRGGAECLNFAADVWGWRHVSKTADIVAYRVVNQGETLKAAVEKGVDKLGGYVFDNNEPFSGHEVPTNRDLWSEEEIKAHKMMLAKERQGHTATITNLRTGHEVEEPSKSVPVTDQSQREVPAKDRQEGGSHYQMPIQPIDFIEKNGIGFSEGNIIKYVVRYKQKGGIKDLRKAQHYLDMLIERMEGEEVE